MRALTHRPPRPSRPSARSAPFRAAVGAAALLVAAGLAGCADRAGGGGATAEDDYPNDEITLVVQAEPGGSSDLSARTLAKQMEKDLGQSIVVENRPGAGGAVGMEYVADQEPDGYTLGYLPVEVVMLGHQGHDVDPDNYDFIGQMNLAPATIAVPKDSPYRTLDDLLRAAKKEPGEITVSNSGAGAIWDVATQALGDEAGVKFQSVPFDGGSPAVTAAVGNKVDAVMASMSETSPAHEDGRLRVLAVLSDEPSDALPDVETAKQQGVDVEIGGWGTLGAPKGLPENVRGTLAEAFDKAAGSKEFRQTIERAGDIPRNVDADEFEPFLKDETERFADLLGEE